MSPPSQERSGDTAVHVNDKMKNLAQDFFKVEVQEDIRCQRVCKVARGRIKQVNKVFVKVQ